MLDDKDAATSAGILATLSSTFFVTQPNSPRAFSASDLAEIFSEAAPGADVRLHAELLPALEAVFAWANERDDRIVIVTGSVLLVGQVLEAMNQQKRSE
jgi:dihydrofolate synthase/folylpolyglutamate synthase